MSVNAAKENRGSLSYMHKQIYYLKMIKNKGRHKNTEAYICLTSGGSHRDIEASSLNNSHLQRCSAHNSVSNNLDFFFLEREEGGNDAMKCKLEAKIT